MEKLISECRKFGLELDDEKCNKLNKFYELLVEKNKVMNLTSITEYDEVMVKHFADSLSLSKMFHVKHCENVLDIGSGAGFPGIPLAICFPEIKFTLLDSLQKRVNFLNDVARELGLDNCVAVHERAEEWIRKTEGWETFDVCTSRAVARLNALTEFCLPYVKKDGYFYAMKSSKTDEEVEEAKNAIEKLGGKLDNVDSFKLADEFERSIVCIKKVKNTDRKYPRPGGKPLSKPL